MTRTLWIFLVLTAHAAWAASASCPVMLSKVKRDTGLCDRITYCFAVDVHNGSAQKITSLYLKAGVMDSLKQFHVMNYNYPLDNLEAGETRKGYYSTHRLLGGDYRGVKVWVSTITYADRSTWADNGDRSCTAQDIKGMSPQ